MKCLIEFLFVKFVQVCVSVWGLLLVFSQKRTDKRFPPTTWCVVCFVPTVLRQRNCSLWEIQRSWPRSEDVCLQWWFKNLLDKQVLWYREAPKHVFLFLKEQSSFGIVQLGQSLGSVFGRGMLTPRLFWMGQLGWTFSRFNRETDIPKVNGFRSWDLVFLAKFYAVFNQFQALSAKAFGLPGGLLVWNSKSWKIAGCARSPKCV